MQQKFAAAFWLVLAVTGACVRLNIGVVKVNLIILDSRKGVIEVRKAGPDGFDLRTLQFDASRSVGAPKNTPTEIINKLNKEINTAMADSKTKARLADLGGTVLSGSPDEFAKLIVEDTEKWGKVIRAANIKPE